MDIKDKLMSWGAWSRSDGNGLGFISPCLLMMRGNVPEDRPPPKTYPISDDEAMLIDAAIKTLRHDYDVFFEVIRRKYFHLQTAKEIARYYLTDKEYPRLVHLDWEHEEKKRSDHRHVGLMLKEAEKMVEKYLLTLPRK